MVNFFPTTSPSKNKPRGLFSEFYGNLRYTKLMWIFSKSQVYILIKLTWNFRKQCALNFILCEFAAIQTFQHTYLKEKTAAFPWRRKSEELSYPFGEVDQCKDQSEDILNSILKE